jgi:hypothetical protein
MPPSDRGATVKLSPDEIKKIGLSLIALAALVYCYLSFLLGPLQTSQASMINTTAELDNKIATSTKMLEHVSELEQTAITAIDRSEKINKMMPEGAPLAWVPPRIRSFFASDDVEAGAVRLLNILPIKQPEMSAFAIDEWIVEFPSAKFLVLAHSIARFENENPLWKIVNVRIRADEADPEQQSVTLGVITIVRK